MYETFALSSHWDQDSFNIYIKTSKTANSWSTVMILSIFVMLLNGFLILSTFLPHRENIKSSNEDCLRNPYERQVSQPSWLWIKSVRENQLHRGLRGENRVQMYYRWNVHSLCLHSAWDAAVGVWYIRPSLADLAAGCVCFPKLPGCECINVIHWQHERQRNYSWRCRAVCYNSGICQLSVLFISHLSLKLFVGLSVNGGSLPVESAVLKCRLLQADAWSNNPE